MTKVETIKTDRSSKHLALIRCLFYWFWAHLWRKGTKLNCMDKILESYHWRFIQEMRLNLRHSNFKLSIEFLCTCKPLGSLTLEHLTLVHHFKFVFCLYHMLWHLKENVSEQFQIQVSSTLSDHYQHTRGIFQ